jgi:p-cumate 2,3-dioxygenase beta subunit
MLTRAEVEDFLYHEAALLDDWRLDEWLALWAADGWYIVPATDAPGGDPRTSLPVIGDDLVHLRARVHQLVAGTAWAEQPRSRTVHMISNVRIVRQDAASLVARSAFAVHRSRRDRQDLYVGCYEHELVVGDPVRIRVKRATLAHDHLHAQARVSILL